MAPIASKSGLLLVHPRLRSPNDSNAEMFHRWTKLHFRDLLNIPWQPSCRARIHKCTRGTAPKDVPDHSHEEKPGMKPVYMYACFTDDIALLKSKPYYDVSRKLNLEHTRSLKNGEEPVGYNNNDKEAMVFDIVDAKFAVYTLFERAPESEEYHEMSKRDRPFDPEQPLIIRINLRNSLGMKPESLMKHVIENLVEGFRLTIGDNADLTIYRWAGKQAQPDEHPLINVEGVTEWMILGHVYMPLEHTPEMSLAHCRDKIKFWVGRAVAECARKLKEKDPSDEQIEEMFEYDVWAAEEYV